jgi:glycosyltransferase involved in cell wall biosynthesis
MGPLVSVFTAAFEIGSGIERTYRSLLAQTYPDWEWVIVDDSRSRDTTGYVRKLADSGESGGRIRLYSQYPSTESIGANKAAAGMLARGEILVELDHDDELLPEALDMVVAGFRGHPELDFLYSDAVDALEGGGTGLYPPGWGLGFGAYASEAVRGQRVPVALSPPITWETIRHIVSAPNHLRAWRGDFYRRIGGHNHLLPVADDYELVLRTFLEGSIGKIPRPLYIQHHHGDQRNASRRRNPEIQQRVAEESARYSLALDRRCLSLGMTPWTSEFSPWTGHEPISTASIIVDPLAEAAERAGMPLVSVVMPTYERPELLARAVESVLAQTYPNFELLVVGDACPSVDGSVATVQDPRVRHWNLAEHAGDNGASPRNYALKAMARGTVIAYLDDDNRWKPDHLESLVTLLVADSAASFGFGSFEIDGDEVICRRPRRFQIDTSALLHRRFLLERFGYWRPPQEVGYAHDWELVARWEGERWLASLRPTLLYSVDASGQSAEVMATIRRVAEEEMAAAAAGPPK